MFEVFCVMNTLLYHGLKLMLHVGLLINANSLVQNTVLVIVFAQVASLIRLFYTLFFDDINRGVAVACSLL